jgi:hypothetical protein
MKRFLEFSLGFFSIAPEFQEHDVTILGIRRGFGVSGRLNPMLH